MVGQLGSALATAHRAGVVHRDVKPANVFLDETGNFYLGDFGIALEAAELSDPTAALSAGSPAYASPEQLRRQPVGPAADVHGLGITMYEALTGRLPFPDAMTQTELLRRQLNEDIPSARDRRPHLPVGVDEVLSRATAKDPTDRYQRVEDLVADFRAAVEAAIEPSGARIGVTTAVRLTEVRNPYKGLQAFTEADAGDFHGRERARWAAGRDPGPRRHRRKDRCGGRSVGDRQVFGRAGRPAPRPSETGPCLVRNDGSSPRCFPDPTLSRSWQLPCSGSPPEPPTT